MALAISIGAVFPQESLKNMAYPASYLKRRNEAIAVFIGRCRNVGYLNLQAFGHEACPNGTRSHPVILLDATENVALASWWDETNGVALEFRIETTEAFREREGRVS